MRTLLLGDIGNRLDIADAEAHISALRSSQSKTVQNLKARDSQIESLTAELGRQKLAVQALTRFLIEKELIAEDELNEFIQEVDAEDGVIDGQIRVEPTKRKLVFGTKTVNPNLFKGFDDIEQ